VSLDRLSKLERWPLEDCRIHDVVFPQIDLNWWNV
jgi:hypothetical protein